MLWAAKKPTPVTPAELAHGRGMDRLVRYVVDNVKAYSIIEGIEASRDVGKRPPLSHNTKVPSKPPLKRTRGGRPSWTHEFAAADRRADAYGGLREDGDIPEQSVSSNEDDLPPLVKREYRPKSRQVHQQVAPVSKRSKESKHKGKKAKSHRKKRRGKDSSSSGSSSSNSSSDTSSDSSSSSSTDSDSSSDSDSDYGRHRRHASLKKAKRSRTKKHKSRRHSRKLGKDRGRLYLSGASFPGAWNREVMRKVLKTMMRRNLVTANEGPKEGLGCRPQAPATTRHRRIHIPKAASYAGRPPRPGSHDNASRSEILATLPGRGGAKEPLQALSTGVPHDCGRPRPPLHGPGAESKRCGRVDRPPRDQSSSSPLPATALLTNVRSEPFKYQLQGRLGSRRRRVSNQR